MTMKAMQTGNSTFRFQINSLQVAGILLAPGQTQAHDGWGRGACHHSSMTLSHIHTQVSLVNQSLCLIIRHAYMERGRRKRNEDMVCGLLPGSFMTQVQQLQVECNR